MKDDRQARLPLSDSDLVRYSRQVIVPGVGAVGQAKLLAATVAVLGNSVGVAHATSYLAASGLRTISSAGGERAECYVFAGIDEVPASTRRLVLARQVPLAWYSLRGTIISSGADCSSAQAHCRSSRRLLPASPPPPELHAVAACDAAAVAIALLLGWDDLEASSEIDLA